MTGVQTCALPIWPALGIEADEEANQRLAEVLGVKGVYVLKVAKGSSAEAAGLKGVTVSRDGIVPGDIVVEVEGKPVDSVARLRARLDDYKVGSQVRVTVLNGGNRREVLITLQPGT